jgi:Dolichyl-phosphate-mannose-protein mannosyltransferase
VTALPVWAWVGVLVGVSAAVRFAIAQNYPGPWIFHDEIAYSDLARSFGRTGEFAIREVPGRNGFGVVYPALIAPAYALFDHVPTAYEAARAINAVVMSLVAVPTYLLARRLVRPSYALIAALLAVALPSMTYTTAIMTENAFYPLFILVALAMYLALERPTIVRQLFVFATILVAFYTRAQAVMFVPAFLLALVIVVLLDAGFETDGRFLDRLRRRLAAYWVSWAVVLGGGAILVIYEHVRGRPLSVLLGTYGGVSLFDYHVGPIARWFVYHIAELDMYVGLFPFAAFLFVAGGLLFTERTRALRIFVAVSVPIVLCFAITVAAYASNPVGNRIEERNFFFVAPLLFIALLVWVDRGLNRRSLAAVASILAACTLPGAIPFESIIDANAVTGTFGLLPLMKLELSWAVPPRNLATIVVLFAIAGGILLLALPRRFALAVPAIVLGYLALISAPIHGITERASIDSASGANSVQRDWVDRAVGSNANVDILYFALQAVPYWQNEFFNASVGRVYNINGRYDGLPQTQVGADPKTQILVDAEHNRLVHSDYILTNQSVLPRGTLVAEDSHTGLRLYRTPGRYVHIEQIVDGLYPDAWSGSSVGYQRYGCRGGSLVVTLTSDRLVHPTNQLVTVTEGTREVARRTITPAHDRGQRMVVPLRSQGGLCAVRFTVTPTAVPASILNNGDTRELGIRFTKFVFRPR